MASQLNKFSLFGFTISRKEAEEIVVSHGGKVSSSVSKKTINPIGGHIDSGLGWEITRPHGQVIAQTALKEPDIHTQGKQLATQLPAKISVFLVAWKDSP